MIKGLSDQRRLPRAGKIKLGVMVQAANGKMYPQATEYFVCPAEVREALQIEQPKVLPIMFHYDAAARIFPQEYKMYKTAGLWCAGNGEVAKRWDEHGELVERECPCEHLENGNCKPLATLKFVLPDVPGLGEWHIDTSSNHTIVGMNTALEQFGEAFGGLRGIPFLLKLEPLKTERWDEGKKSMVATTIHVMRLDSPFTLRQIVEWRGKQGKAVESLMPGVIDDEVKQLGPGEPEVNHVVDPKSAREADPDAARQAEPAPWDVSMLYREAQKLDVSKDLYQKYLIAVFGPEVSDEAIEVERARFERLKTPGERALQKVAIIQVVKAAEKRNGK